MKKYFNLQLKLAAKFLPFVLAVTMVLVLGLGIILSNMLTGLQDSEAKRELTVALTGDTDNSYLRWGIAALQMADDSQFSLSVVEMTQAQAHSALEKGEISAYVIMPEGMMEKALAGEAFEPVTYVTSVGMEGIAGYIKREITDIVTEIVIYSQKGSYGMAELLEDEGLDQDVNHHMTILSLQYADMIIDRDEFYETQVLGVSDGLSTGDYYAGAVVVIFLMLMGLPYAALYIRQDYALPQMLRSRGFSNLWQLLCEYGVHFLTLAALCGFLLMVAAYFALASAELIWALIPVLLMIAALNMLVFTVADNIVSGLLLHFFGAIGLCYVSGCIFPITAFPTVVQKIAGFLPTGMARQHLASVFTGSSDWGSLGGLVVYTVVFLGAALLVRTQKTAGIERWRR